MMAMEDITHGELIRAYSIEGLVKPDRWEKLCEGQCVGHKRIQNVSPVEVAAIRLRSTQALAEPRIRRLTVFDTSSH